MRTWKSLRPKVLDDGTVLIACECGRPVLIHGMGRPWTEAACPCGRKWRLIALAALGTDASDDSGGLSELIGATIEEEAADFNVLFEGVSGPVTIGDVRGWAAQAKELARLAERGESLREAATTFAGHAASRDTLEDLARGIADVGPGEAEWVRNVIEAAYDPAAAPEEVRDEIQG